jgi:CheY-like chemotaxis protein
MTRILLIEDDIAVQKVLAEVLRLAGYDVQTTDDGIPAVEMVKDHAPDLIISDVRLPFMDGYEVLETVRKNPSTARVPFVLLSSRYNPDSPRDLSADAYVPKPFDMDELLACIRQLLPQALAS